MLIKNELYISLIETNSKKSIKRALLNMTNDSNIR